MEQERKDREERQIVWKRESEERAAKEHNRKLEMMEIEGKEQVSGSLGFTTPHVKGPKLPPFEEGKDNMDAYIQRFERYATVQNWQKEQWGEHLSALLKGRAFDVFF